MADVLLLGAHGAIGSVLARALRARDHCLTLGTRSGVGGTVAFADIMSQVPDSPYDLVIDASSGSLGDYYQLSQWLNAEAAHNCVHFSTIRAASDNEKDGYALHKRSVLAFLQDVTTPLTVIEGDLFADGAALVGYWDFVTDYTRWRFMSDRPLAVADLKNVAAVLDDLARGETPEPTERLRDLPVTDIRMTQLPCVRLSTRAAKLMFQVRMNVLLRPFKRCVVL